MKLILEMSEGRDFPFGTNGTFKEAIKKIVRKKLSLREEDVIIVKLKKEKNGKNKNH